MVCWTHGKEIPRDEHPRRYLFRGVCDECGGKFEDYRPRPRVRRKISPFVFCCPAHKNSHWRRRKAAERLAEALPYPCAGPGDDGRGCPNLIEPRSGPGGPQLYCDRTCRAAAARARRQQRPMARSAATLLERALAAGERYVSAKKEHRLRLQRFGSDAAAQAATFAKHGGREGYLAFVEDQLQQLSDKWGWDLSRLTPRGREEVSTARRYWGEHRVALQRIAELEEDGGDARRLARVTGWMKQFFRKCQRLAADRDAAWVRRARRRGGSSA